MATIRSMPCRGDAPVATRGRRVAVFVAALVAGLAGATAARAARPNFLLIAVDDLNHYTAQHLDQSDVFLRKVYPDDATRADLGRRLTPNLRRLASQSLVFSRAYCASPLCGPSRTALLTGVPPHRSGCYLHQGHFRHIPALADVVTLPQYLKANGYFTVGTGKVFHKSLVETEDGRRHDWPDSDHSWSLWIERYIGSNVDRATGGARPAPEFSPYSPNDGLFAFGRCLVPVEQSLDFRNARFAADLFATGRATITDLHGHDREAVLPPDQPFFLAVGLFLPHLPWVVPQEFIDRFPVAEMRIDAALVRWVEDDVTDLPPGNAKRWVGPDFDVLIAAGEKIAGPGGVVEAWKAAIQHNLASIAFADHCLGQIVDAIERSPHRDDTVVMLWGDHGFNVGDKRRFRKQALWEGTTHLEFLWRDPAAPAGHGGRECSQLVSLQDIYPTVVARAGLPIPPHVHGRDLAPLLADPDAPTWENELLCTYQEGNHAIRTRTHRYIRYRDGGRELYDLVADPWEFTNLAADPAHAATVAELDRALESRLARPR